MRKPIKTKPYDAALFLDNEETIAAYLDEALASGELALIVEAIGAVARARGIGKVAESADLSRESLDRSLGRDGNPEFATIVRVLQALGLRLTVQPVAV